MALENDTEIYLHLEHDWPNVVVIVSDIEAMICTKSLCRHQERISDQIRELQSVNGLVPFPLSKHDLETSLRFRLNYNHQLREQADLYLDHLRSFVDIYNELVPMIDNIVPAPAFVSSDQRIVLSKRVRETPNLKSIVANMDADLLKRVMIEAVAHLDHPLLHRAISAVLPPVAIEEWFGFPDTLSASIISFLNHLDFMDFRRVNHTFLRVSRLPGTQVCMYRSTSSLGNDCNIPICISKLFISDCGYHNSHAKFDLGLLFPRMKEIQCFEFPHYQFKDYPSLEVLRFCAAKQRPVLRILSFEYLRRLPALRILSFEFLSDLSYKNLWKQRKWFLNKLVEFHVHEAHSILRAKLLELICLMPRLKSATVTVSLDELGSELKQLNQVQSVPALDELTINLNLQDTNIFMSEWHKLFETVRDVFPTVKHLSYGITEYFRGTMRQGFMYSEQVVQLRCDVPITIDLAIQVMNSCRETLQALRLGHIEAEWDNIVSAPVSQLNVELSPQCVEEFLGLFSLFLTRHASHLVSASIRFGIGNGLEYLLKNLKIHYRNYWKLYEDFLVMLQHTRLRQNMFVSFGLPSPYFSFVASELWSKSENIQWSNNLTKRIQAFDAPVIVQLQGILFHAESWNELRDHQDTIFLSETTIQFHHKGEAVLCAKGKANDGSCGKEKQNF